MTAKRFDHLRAEFTRLSALDMAEQTYREILTDLFAPSPRVDAFRASLAPEEYTEYLHILEDRAVSRGTDMGGWITY